MNEQWLNLYRTEIEEFHKKTMAFAAGELPRKDYKGASGGFGSYAQRDGTKHMLRLRLPGGRLTRPPAAVPGPASPASTASRP